MMELNVSRSKAQKQILNIFTVENPPNLDNWNGSSCILSQVSEASIILEAKLKVGRTATNDNLCKTKTKYHVRMMYSKNTYQFKMYPEPFQKDFLWLPKFVWRMDQTDEFLDNFGFF